MIILGLTGSIGMGKSTTAAMLEHLGVPVHDADAAVHMLMSADSKAIAAIKSAFPPEQYPDIYGHAAVNRSALGKYVFADKALREKLEAILHPLVRKAQQDFMKAQQALGIKILALDIPLLFETGADKRVDYTLVCSAPAFIQRSRVLKRPGMDAAKFHAILSSQMSDKEKRARADFVVQTGLGRAYAMCQVKKILKKIRP